VNRHHYELVGGVVTGKKKDATVGESKTIDRGGVGSRLEDPFH